MSMTILDVEIDRIMLLIKNFGWELVEKKKFDQKTQITLEKDLSQLEEKIRETFWTQITLEKDLSQLEEKIRETFWVRVRDVLNMFGWKILEETTDENLLALRAEKSTLGGDVVRDGDTAED